MRRENSMVEDRYVRNGYFEAACCMHITKILISLADFINEKHCINFGNTRRHARGGDWECGLRPAAGARGPGRTLDPATSPMVREVDVSWLLLLYDSIGFFVCGHFLTALSGNRRETARAHTTLPSVRAGAVWPAAGRACPRQ